MNKIISKRQKMFFTFDKLDIALSKIVQLKNVGYKYLIADFNKNIIDLKNDDSITEKEKILLVSKALERLDDIGYLDLVL